MVTLNPIVLTHSYFLGSVSFPSLLKKLPSITAEERNDSADNSGSAVVRHFAIHNSLQGVAKLMTHSRTHALGEAEMMTSYGGAPVYRIPHDCDS